MSIRGDMPALHVLGIAQDGGVPQAGCRRACCSDAVVRLPACLALVDGDRRWFVDCTPAFPAQLRRLDAVAPGGLDGILLTHAHIGHYTGLVHLGREAMSTRALPLHVQPRMATFLGENGPWRQLVERGNVRLDVADGWTLSPRLRVEAVPVPHRDEVSETVALRIHGPRGRALWLPDIDAWDQDALLDDVDVAWIDGTFWADGELDRDMAEVPHPRMAELVERFAALPVATRAKVRFVHLNHTNPAVRPDSPEAAKVRAAGLRIAEEGERVDV